MKSLIQTSKIAISESSHLITIPEESLWLANFTSKATQKTYKKAVAQFLIFSNIQGIDDLRATNQALILSWRNQLIGAGASPLCQDSCRLRFS